MNTPMTVTLTTCQYLRTTDLRIPKNKLIYDTAACVYALTHPDLITPAQRAYLHKLELYSLIIHFLTTGYLDSYLRSLPIPAKRMILYAKDNNPF